jgi:cytoskeleton protein RodZ
MLVSDPQSTEMGRPVEDATPTVGAMLKAARDGAELSLEQLAGELRIEQRYLAALEQDRFEAVGPPVFAKGYLKQYGQRLGLAYGDLLAQYYRQVEPRQVEIVPQRAVRLKRPKVSASQGVATAVAVAAATLVALWWWNRAPPAAEPVVVSEPNSPAVGATAEDSPPAAPFDVAPAVAPVLLAESAPAPDDAPLSPTMAVVLEFDEECWAEVTDATGRRVFYGLGLPGTESRFSAEPPLAFLLGNSRGVRLTIDGAPFAVPGSARASRLVRFAVAAPER